MTEKQAITRIAAYCSKAERCIYDAKKKLTAWELENDAVNRIVLLLQKEKFLDEERFCRSYIKDKIRFNKWGKNKIVFELRKKQIPETLIYSALDEALEDCDFESSLMKILSIKVPSVKAKSDYEKRVKLYRFALGRGFTPDLIQKCLNKILDSSTDEFSF